MAYSLPKFGTRLHNFLGALAAISESFAAPMIEELTINSVQPPRAGFHGILACELQPHRRRSWIVCPIR